MHAFHYIYELFPCQGFFLFLTETFPFCAQKTRHPFSQGNAPPKQESIDCYNFLSYNLPMGSNLQIQSLLLKRQRRLLVLLQLLHPMPSVYCRIRSVKTLYSLFSCQHTLNNLAKVW